MGDGNGWVHCARGHRHWGLFGAAGLLVTDGAHVLLQHRAAWTHEGDTWAVPGGARDSHEDPFTAAVREAVEETSFDPRTIVARHEWIDDHGGWAYTTIVATTAQRTQIEPANAESTAVRWWPLGDVDGLTLHRGFAAAWPELRRLVGADPTR